MFFLVLWACCLGFPDVADPSIPHVLGVEPCVTPLFDTLFEGYDNHPFDFTPPSTSCLSGARIILDLSCNVTKGRQFDRTLYVEVGGAVVFLGTTSEPLKNDGPSWDVHADVSDYAAVFAVAKSGIVSLGTVVDGTYNGVPGCSARLLLYPQKQSHPDVVVPLGQTGGSQLSVVAQGIPFQQASEAYLLFQAQGQQGDEFWWSCVPNNLTKPLAGCGNTALRNLLVLIDNQPAAIFPLYPYIFTGGVDPYLWHPTPAVQALYLLPQRINLLPGMFTNSSANIVLQVYPASNSSWFLSASLFFKTSADVERSFVTLNSLPTQLPQSAPSVVDQLSIQGPVVEGTLSVAQEVRYTLAGTVVYSSGKQVQQAFVTTVRFSNVQTYNSNASVSFSVVDQLGSFEQIAQTSTSSSSRVVEILRLSYPLQVTSSSIATVPTNPNVQNMTTTVLQGYLLTRSVMVDQNKTFEGRVTNQVFANDTLIVNVTGGNFQLLGNADASSNQTFSYKDTQGNCYHKFVSSNKNILNSTSVECQALDFWANPFIASVAPEGLSSRPYRLGSFVSSLRNQTLPSSTFQRFRKFLL